MKKLAYNIFDTLYRYFLIFNPKNKEKYLQLFLYERNIEYIFYYGRVFIKLDSRGEEFIKKVLGNFMEYQPGVNTNYKHRNQFIHSVYTNRNFEFEFISPQYWNHLQLAMKLAELGQLELLIDDLYVTLINSIDPKTSSIRLEGSEEELPGYKIALSQGFLGDVPSLMPQALQKRKEEQENMIGLRG